MLRGKPGSNSAVLMEPLESPELLELSELSFLAGYSSPVQSIYLEDFFLFLLCLALEDFFSLCCLGL